MLFEVKISLFLIVDMLRIFVSVVWGTIRDESAKPFFSPDSSPRPACQGWGPGRVRLSWLQTVGVSWDWE